MPQSLDTNQNKCPHSQYGTHLRTLGKALSERKIEAEQALKGAVEAVGIMQQQMQTLQAEEKHAAKGAQKILM